MPARGDVPASLGDEDVIDLFSNRLPELLERRPDLEPTIFGAFLKTFARREEVALVLTELRTLRTEMNQRFEQVGRQMHEVRTEVATGFGEVQRSIDRLGARWGIRSESVFRQTFWPRRRSTAAGLTNCG